MYSVKSSIRVRYADTDQMHGVYNGRYFEYFEVARADLMRSLGMTYRQFEGAGFFLPLTEAYAKYLRQIKYDEVIDVVSMLKEPPAARLRIDYEILKRWPEDDRGLHRAQLCRREIRKASTSPENILGFARRKIIR